MTRLLMQRVRASTVNQALRQCITTIVLDDRQVLGFQALIPFIMHASYSERFLQEAVDVLKSVVARSSSSARFQRLEGFIYRNTLSFLDKNDQKKMPTLARAWNKVPRSATQKSLLKDCIIKEEDSESVRELKKYVSYVLLERAEAAAFRPLAQLISSTAEISIEFKTLIMDVLKPLVVQPPVSVWQRLPRFMSDNVMSFLPVSDQLLAAQRLGRAWKNQTKIPYGILDLTGLKDKEKILALLEKYGRKTSRPALFTKIVLPLSLTCQELESYLRPYTRVTDITLSPSQRSLKSQFMNIGAIYPRLKTLSLVKKGTLLARNFLAENNEEKVQILPDLMEFKIKVQCLVTMEWNGHRHVGDVKARMLAAQINLLPAQIKKLDVDIFFERSGYHWDEPMRRVKIADSFFEELSKKTELTCVSFRSNVNINLDNAVNFPPNLTSFILNKLEDDFFKEVVGNAVPSKYYHENKVGHGIAGYTGISMEYDSFRHLLDGIINHAYKLEVLQFKKINIYEWCLEDYQRIPKVIDCIDYEWKLEGNEVESRARLIDDLMKIKMNVDAYISKMKNFWGRTRKQIYGGSPQTLGY
jgi:hypothetical protein